MAFRCLAALLLTAWSCAAAGRFGASFDGYEAGEPLTDKGATGGGWEPFAADAVASNVVEGARGAIAFSSVEALVFASDTVGAETTSRVEFSICPDALMGGEPPPDEGMAALSPAIVILVLSPPKFSAFWFIHLRAKI